MGAAWAYLRWFGAYWLSRSGLMVGRLLPARLLYGIADPFALIAYFLLGRHRRNLIKNLRPVVGEQDAAATARRVFRNFARYIIDFYQLPAHGKQALRRRVDFHSWRELDQALEADKGTIFVTLHLGQAELGAGALSAYGHPISVIAETFDYGPMNRFLQDLRRSLGMKIIPAGSAKPGVLRCLNRGEALGLMFDAVEPSEGITVDFLGQPAEFSATPARIAVRTGAKIMPGVVSRQDSDDTRFLTEIDFDLEFEPTGDENTDVHSLTQAIANSLEPMVRQHPDQWFAFHPVWQQPSEPKATTAAWMQWSLTLATWAGGVLPRRAAYALAGVAGDLAFLARASARANVQDNMRHVLGNSASDSKVSRATREVFRSVTRYYVDLVRLPHSTAAELLNHEIKIHGLEQLTEPTSRGQGVVVAAAHYGSPEMGAQAGALLGLDVLVMAEPLQPPAFAKAMHHMRTVHGARYENVSFSGMAGALRHLRAGGVLAMTCDRDIQKTGSPLTFFGETARMPLGAVELAARTGAVLVPGYSHRSGNRIDVFFDQPLELVNTGRPKEDALVNGAATLARIEPWIKKDPGQWMILERIWKPMSKNSKKAIAEYPDPTQINSGSVANASEDGLHERDRPASTAVIQ